MSFPQTRLILIQRLASGGNDEDVACHTFSVVWENRLLGRWVSNRSAKLRSLLCAVVRNILSNWNRVRATRQRLSDELVRQVEESSRARDEQSDAFYAAWVEDLLQQAYDLLDPVQAERHRGAGLTKAMTRLTSLIRMPADAQSSRDTP
jgi:hypothetical protein